MNILILNWKDVKHPHAGGAEIIAFELARRLAKTGNTVTFFSSNYQGGKPQEIVDGVKVIRKGTLYTVYFHAFFFVRGLTQKPDKVLEMINTICWHTWIYVHKKNRIAYLNQLAKEVWFYEFPRLLAVLGYIGERIEYIPYRNSRFICYSDSTKEDLISYGVKRENIQTFSLGIDHKRYKVGGKKSKEPLFVFVARLVRMKQTDLCIRAMRKVVRRYPKAKLAIIGNGPEENNLQKLAVKLRLSRNIVFINKNNFFLGDNPKDMKVTLMRQSWAHLLPSVKEGWGMVVTEAAACGTPSIVSGVSGLRDSVVNGQTGIVLSQKPTSGELADAMIEFIDNKKMRKELTDGAIKWSKFFNWDKSFEEFKKILIN